MRALFFFALGCRSAPEPIQTEPLVLGAVTLQVPAGSVDRINGYEAVLREDAQLRKKPGIEGLGMRAPWQITLQLTAEAPELPCASPSTFWVRAGVWAESCGLVPKGGGSGGIEYVHQGRLALTDGGYLGFVFHDQEEPPGKPRGDLLLLVLQSAP